VWRELGAEGQVLCERTLSFLESVGTPEAYLAPRREALDGWRRVVKAEGSDRTDYRSIEAKTAARQHVDPLMRIGSKG
jgi:hypothetical protein